jgi:hypothetical protein
MRATRHLPQNANWVAGDEAPDMPGDDLRADRETAGYA